MRLKNIAKKGTNDDSIYSRNDIRSGVRVYDIGDSYRREG